MIVADSDVLIDALRGREPVASRIASGISDGNLTTTAISVFELLSGARTDSERSKVTRLLGGLTILPCDEKAGIVAAEIRRRLEAQGATIGMADYLIAGVCLSRSATLLTRNLDHFERIPDLALGNISDLPAQ